MHLSELKALHVSELITMGEALEIENVARMRKQELMFAIMKKRAKGGEQVFGDGVLEVLLVLGWSGGVIFLLSAGAALWMSYAAVRSRGVGVGYLAAATALLAQVVGGTIFSGVGGAMFWLAVAMAMTGRLSPPVRVAARVAPGVPA